MPLRRVGDETPKAPTAAPIVSAPPESERVAKDLADSFEAAMETDEVLTCGIESPDECEACT